MLYNTTIFTNAAEQIILKNKDAYASIITDISYDDLVSFTTNRSNPNGSFRGKTSTIGKLDALDLENNCICGNHLLDGVVTGSKIANNSIIPEHLQNNLFNLSKIWY